MKNSINSLTTRFLKGFLPVSFLLLLLLSFTPAQGQVWWEDDFSQFDRNRYFVQGNRTYWDQNGRYFVLTPPENSLAGRIYHRERVFTGVFEAEFDIRIGGGTGADGMTIAWVTNYNYQAASGGAHDFNVENGYAVEFDCYNNAGIDPNGQHIAILRNNWQNHLASWQANEGVIENNQWHHIRVTNELGYVQVWFDNQRVLEHRIRDYQAFEGYFGFTAGTGGATNWHIVDNIRIAIGGPEMALSRDRLEFGPIDRDRQRVLGLVIANRAQGEENWKRLQFAITDSGQGPDWLSADPSEGTVDPGDSVVVRVTARPEGIDVGEYSRRLYIQSNDPYRQIVSLPAHLWVVEGVGRLRGIISDARAGEPIAGARVSDDRFEISDTTDEQGRYDLGELGSFRYQLAIVKRDYLPRVEEVEVPGGEEVEANFSLYQSILDPQPARVMVSVPVDEEFRTSITLRNPGNGPLTWSARLRFPAGGEMEPYRLRLYVPVADTVGDNRLVGIEFVEGYFYVAGGNNGAGRGNVYVFDPRGNYVRQFSQFMNSAWGMRDLAWDGEHLWGGDGNILFAFTTEGDSVRSIRSPINPSRAIAWDPTREVLWTCDVLSDVVGLDREGEERARIRRPGVRIYGLAWYPLDPEGFYLYAYTSDDQHSNALHRINPATGQVQFLTDLPVEGDGRAGGFAITHQW
ncbi:MAG: lectin-like domain-containing protein, partial [bacterium]